MRSRLAPVTIAVAALLLVRARPALADETFSSPDWLITMSDFGYSDFVLYTAGPFPAGSIHEMLSGEWAAAIGYDGIQMRLPAPNVTMWLEPSFLYPDWMTNSLFTVVTPLSFPMDTDGDGLPEGFSIIDNGDVQIKISIDFEDTVDGTPLGLGPLASPVLSNRYVLLVTYEVTNISGHPLTNLRFYQFMHGHPANTEIPTVNEVYDPALYFGAREEFRYDITQFATNSGATDGSPTGCSFTDHVGFAADALPAMRGMGHYRGHFGRPPTGLHLDVENDTLGGQSSFGPDEVAGAERFDLASLGVNQTANFPFLLAVHSIESSGAGSNPSTTCVMIVPTGGDPQITVTPGACGAPSAGGPYDVISGDLRQLQDLGGVVTVGTATCHANDLAADRITLTHDLSPCQPSVFILVRRGSGIQFDYGTASNGSPRFDLTSSCP